jgi:hypothetical protein
MGSQIMARGKAAFIGKWLAITAAAAIAGAALLPIAAQAQFFGWGGRPYRAQQQPSRGFFFPFFGRPYGAPHPAQHWAQPPVESFRAPPPRKPTSQPTSTVVVIGDSMADWLAYGLEEIYADQPQIGIARKIRLNSGLIHYEPRNDSLEWSQAVKDILADEKPAALVVMLGLNDRVPLRVPAPPHQAGQREGKGKDPAQANQPAQKQEKGKDSQQAPAATQAAAAKQSGEGEQPTAQAQPAPGIYDFHTDDWAKLYRKRVDDMIAALKSKGVPVLWVGLPALRGPHATADMSYLDDLYRASADKADIDYVDVWNGFVDENGRYSVMGPDFEGQTRRLRSGDGVHFTKYGALKLAHLVDQELSRAMANPVAPAAAPQAAAPAKPGAARSAVGPILPLTAPGGARIGDVGGAGESGQLVGGSQLAPADPDPTAAAVLVRGDALPAPPGRADNFAWPLANETNSATKP